MDHILRLWAPFVPHITEELSHIIFGADKSIHSRGNWPKADLPENEEAEKIGIEAVAILEEVRKSKSEAGVSIKFPVKTLAVTSDLELSNITEDLKSVTSSESINFSKGELKVAVTLGEKEAVL
jgi:valyl-tRNA synthetase